MISKLRYIIFLLLLIITIYFYIHNRKSGCKNKKAINYNPDADIGDESKCRYNTLGCMDKNASNYNMYATASCEEDCQGCEEKGTCDLCKYQKECKHHCPECICKPKVKGCNRVWAINYDPTATDDNGSCISPEKLLEKISIISGGDCKRCSGRVSIKIGDDYPILGGKQGINVLVLERSNNLKIRYKRSFMTANYELENKKFVDFMRKYVFYKDIVIIAIRGDAVGKKRSLNFNNEPVFIESVLTDDSKMVLKKLGAKTPELSRSGSYILVGSFLNDIYFETYSSNADSFFPYFNLTNYGCVNFNSPEYEKIELDLSKLKLLSSTGDTGESNIYDAKSDDKTKYINIKKSNFVDMNRVDNINRCALEVIQMGYRIFSVSKTKCYAYKLKDSKGNNPLKFFKNKQFTEYTENNKFFRLSNNVCRLNNQLLPYGNETEESLFLIDEIYFSGLYSKFYGGQMVELYNLRDFKGIRRDVGVGIHQAWGSIPKALNVKEGSLIYIPITSLRIPHEFKVTLFRNVSADEDLTKFKKYELKFEDAYNSFSKLNMSCCEGGKITTANTSTKKIIRTLKFRIWNNIIKNLNLKRTEVLAKLYIYDSSVPQVDVKPENNDKYQFIDKYDLNLYSEIERLKNENNHGKIGFIELFNYSRKKVRKIEFTTWEFFWSYNFTLTVNAWKDWYISEGGIPMPNEGIFTVHAVDPNKKLLDKTCTLYGAEENSKEISDGFTHKSCSNIAKYGKYACEDSGKEKGFTNDIKYIVVSKQNFGVTIYDEPDFDGASLTLGYGKYNLPDDLSMIVQSLKVNLKYAIIKLYLGYNFKNEFLRVVNKHTKQLKKAFTYSNIFNLLGENKRIRSISIEKLDYYTEISNNSYPDKYDENKKYENYQYPIKYKLSNELINYLDYPYDYFKDEIKLDSNDKFVRVVRENFEFSKLKAISPIQVGNNQIFRIINSGGGINYVKNEIGNNNFKNLITDVKAINTYNSNNDFIRKIIFYGGKIMKYDGNKVSLLDLDNLDFSIDERFIQICSLDNAEVNIYKNNIAIFIKINGVLKTFGKFLTIKNNDKFIRINYDEIDMENVKRKKVNLILVDNKQESVIEENISNSSSSDIYNFYIIKRNIESTEIPTNPKTGTPLCNCNIFDSEYDFTNFIYIQLEKLTFKNKLNSISLAQKVTTLKELGIMELNNNELLDNIGGKRFNSPTIVQIMDSKFNINKMLYFNCHKYTINNNINTINKLEKVGENDIKISKHEKRVEIFMREKSNFNNNYENKYESKFNTRQDLNSVLLSNIQDNINKINSQLKDSGSLETYDFNQKLMRKSTFKNYLLDDNIKVQDITKFKFNTTEKFISVYNKNKVKICTLPFFYNLNTNSINSAINTYLFKYECFIKIYDINMKLIKVGLCKNKKYIFTDKKTNKNIELNYKKYIGKFNNFEWQTAEDNYIFDLDEIYFEIELAKPVKTNIENSTEILFIVVKNNNLMKSFDDVLKSFGYNNAWREYTFRFLLTRKMYSILRFYDINNKVTKKIKFSFEPVLDSSFGAPVPRSPILLYDNPVKYIETYKNNIIYEFLQKDKMIFSVNIPNGMKGIYTYKIDGKIVYADKIICDDGNNIKIYDENNNLITESGDETLHEYILGIKFDKYNGRKIFEYYPKTNKSIIRLLDNNINIDTILTKDVDENKIINIEDQLGNVINTVTNRNIYILENDYSALKVIKPDKTFKFIFASVNGEF